MGSSSASDASEVDISDTVLVTGKKIGVKVNCLAMGMGGDGTPLGISCVTWIPIFVGVEQFNVVLGTRTLPDWNGGEEFNVMLRTRLPGMVLGEYSAGG
jgi:hypothetical protein